MKLIKIFIDSCTLLLLSPGQKHILKELFKVTALFQICLLNTLCFRPVSCNVHQTPGGQRLRRRQWRGEGASREAVGCRRLPPTEAAADSRSAPAHGNPAGFYETCGAGADDHPPIYTGGLYFFIYRVTT